MFVLYTLVIDFLCYLLSSEKAALLGLPGSLGVDSSGGSAGGTSFPRAKGFWQSSQKQKTVDDLVRKRLVSLLIMKINCA